MIKTVMFDLGGVIVPLDFDRGIRALGGRCPFSPGEIRRRLSSTDLIMRFESGLLEPAEFHRRLSELLELDAGYEEFADLWSAIFLPDTLIPERLVAQLRGRFRLLLLSNTNALHFQWIRQRYPVLGHFDAFILSYQVGAMKPAPRIYREAIRQAGCRPQECFFTDDMPAYVEAARQEGIDAVRFESAGQLEGELLQRGCGIF